MDFFNFDWMDIATLIGATGAIIVSKKKTNIRKYGFIFDIVACFAWSYYTVTYIKTPGAIFVQIIYISAAINGIREHFRK